MSGKAYTGYMHDYMHATSCLSILTANNNNKFSTFTCWFIPNIPPYCTLRMAGGLIICFRYTFVSSVVDPAKFIPDPIAVRRFQTIPNHDPNPD
jgi:hypothetical protein